MEFGSGLRLVSRLGAVLACFTKNERSVHHMQRCSTNQKKKKKSREKNIFVGKNLWRTVDIWCYNTKPLYTLQSSIASTVAWQMCTDTTAALLNCCVAGRRPLALRPPPFEGRALSEPYAAELQQFVENLGNRPIVSNGLCSGHLIPMATDGTTILLILKL